MTQELVSVIDAHVHIYDPAKFLYPWLSGVPQIEKAHTIDEYVARTRQVFNLERFVFVEVGIEDKSALAEAEWIASQAKDQPKLGAIVAHALLERGAAVREDLDRLAAMPKVVGVRRLFEKPFQSDLDFPIRPSFVEGVKLLPEYGFSYDLCGAEYNVENMVKLVRLCPEVTFVLDHIGKPLIASGGWEPWRSHIRSLATMDNVSVKISGLLTEAGGPYRANIERYVHEVVDAFGFDRVMYGSDYPVQELAGGLEQWFGLIDGIMAVYTLDERAKYFSENARRIYRL
ncbi:amidohydrolase family protein [Mesorhizobium sp. M0701]|uniref:amidohydrolase family protein n=1 Tax=Mesorhizobium sp. M0701 TaxID=2956989 RepID=UPI003338E8B4